jgi:hypothetical protein
MVNELLKQEGRSMGAIGFEIEGTRPLSIRQGGCEVRGGGGQANGYPTHEQTADGHAMATGPGAVIPSRSTYRPDHRSGSARVAAHVPVLTSGGRSASRACGRSEAC